jgi:predicted transposase YdaD
MEHREKAKHDHATLLYAAETRGKNLGVAQSRAEIARNMKRLGLSLDVIEKVTGLEPEAIKRL